MRTWLAAFLIVGVAVVSAAPAAQSSGRKLGRTTMTQLSSLRAGQVRVVDAFPVGPSESASIYFEHVQVYAPGAHVYLVTAGGRKEIPRSNLVFLRGYSGDGKARVALTLNADSTFNRGFGSGPGGEFVLRASSAAGGSTRLVALSLASALPKGYKLDFRCGNDAGNFDVHSIGDLATRLRAPAPAAAASTAAAQSQSLRLATIAIDTDTAFMSKLFSNNTTDATNYIATMFNIMNLMYERDLLVRLNIGTTILRTGSDPYSSLAPNAPVITSELNTFGDYWKTNESGVTRSFATLLSGKIDGTSISCNSSGLAWVDQYCQKGFVDSNTNTVGSYSVEKVCTSTNTDLSLALNPRVVGHELGHNFGAYHTHCTDKTTAAAPVATNTIDQCYNIESGCYSGTASCPVAGTGTIMSYCNFTNVSGCQDNTQTLLEFHPTEASKIDGYVTAESSCLNATDDVFYDGFE